jgi:hypothetical protein
MSDTVYPPKDAHGRPRTPYAVWCEGPFDMPGVQCGLVYLTEDEYERQMNAPDRTWRCPICRYDARWSDANFEEMTCEADER